MKRAAIAGFVAGLAMMIGGAVGAVSNLDPKPVVQPDGDVMNPMIAGQAMLPGRGIIENIAGSPEHTKLMAALRQSGVAATLAGKQAYTLFAPTDAAFGAEGKAGAATLARRMAYLLVPGRYDSQALLARINESGGEARLRTAEGGVLIARLNGPTNIVIMDERGRTADIAIYDIRNSDGVVQVIDHVMAPSGPSRQMASN